MVAANIVAAVMVAAVVLALVAVAACPAMLLRASFNCHQRRIKNWSHRVRMMRAHMTTHHIGIE